MKKKKIIVAIIIVILLILIIVLALKDKKQIYTCANQTTGLLKEQIYRYYYNDDGKITKTEITKRYKAQNSDERTNLANLIWIIENENEEYNNKYSVTTKVLTNNASEYYYLLTIDPSKLDEEASILFKTKNTINEQKEYLQSFKNITCK